MNYPDGEARNRSRDHVSVLFARHPLERFLAVFRNRREKATSVAKERELELATFHFQLNIQWLYCYHPITEVKLL